MPETNHHLGLRGGLGTSPTSLVTCSPQVATQATDSPPSSAVSQRWAASCRSHPCCCAPALRKMFGKRRRGGRDTRGASMAPASFAAQVPCGKQQQQVSPPTSSTRQDSKLTQAPQSPQSVPRSHKTSNTAALSGCDSGGACALGLPSSHTPLRV